ncbi:MAG: diacylglycerol kinase family lipid kinase [Coriobacteriia bacterium]|nr:diacylglycerol kinase family lipid kinase [Coriobacteriia bacterium]
MTKKRVRRIKVIINPAAGQPEPVLGVLNEAFAPTGIEWDVAITHGSGDAETAAREAVADGYDFVGAYGGDGTIAEVASGLAEGKVPFLLLPGGTGNVLAAELGIPADLASAAALLAGEHEIRRVDLGRSGGKWFVVRLTMGLEVAVVDAATPDLKSRFGWLAYAYAGFAALSTAPVATYTITVDGETFEADGLALIVANSASTGVAGTRLVDGVDVSDGRLDVVVLQGADLSSMLGSAADAAQGLPPRAFARWSGKEIRVDATPEQTVVSDGEEAGVTPIEVCVVAGALRVVVPKGA